MHVFYSALRGVEKGQPKSFVSGRRNGQRLLITTVRDGLIL